jgi:glycosyltransferase involved in cell wall biosynthesis
MDLHVFDLIVAVLQRLAVIVGVVFAKMLTLFIVSISLGLLHLSHDSYRKMTGKRGQVAIVLPIIPDLSHTFIYREVLAMQELGAQFKVISLAEGDYGVVHPEARALLQEVVFVPKISQVGYLLLYLSMLIRHPINMARLLSFYKSCGCGDIFLFADPNNLYNSPHPCKGLLLARTLQKHDASYLHVYGSMYPATQTLVASILLGIPFSLSTFVDFESEYDFKMFSQKCELASFVVVVTQFCVTRILSLTSQQLNGKLHVVYHGIDPSYARIPPDRDSSRKKLSVIAVGRFVEKKGFEYLVKACAVLRDRGVLVTCSIVGDGPERSHLQSSISKLQLGDMVKLLEPLPNDRLRDLISSYCVLVAPSVYSHDGERDGIPIVLLEAMCLGTAVIATRISGIPELVTHSEDGLLVPERDENALADAIEQLLTDSDLRRRLSARACEKVLRDFTTEAGAKTLWSLIQSEIERR